MPSPPASGPFHAVPPASPRAAVASCAAALTDAAASSRAGAPLGVADWSRGADSSRAGAASRASRAGVVFRSRIPRSGHLTSSRGQASVELVVLLPVIVVVLAVAYQALLAGQAVWEVRVAARAAARAHAVGADASAAARSHLRARLERGLHVRAADDGDVRVSVRIPTVLPPVRLGRVSATSHFRPQGG